MRGRVSWALLTAIVSVCASCTYILGIEDLELEPGAGGAGGAGGDAGGSPTTSSGGGSGGAGGGTGGGGGCTSCPVDVATQQDNPNGVIVVGTNIYWNNNNSVVMIADPAGQNGGTTVFTSAALINNSKIAANANQIYALLSTGEVEEANLPPPTSSMVIPGVASATYLAVDDSTYYWYNNGDTVFRGVSTPVLSSLTSTRGIIVDSVEGTLFHASDVAIVRVPSGGGSSTTLKDSIPSPGVGGFAIDANNVYWYDQADDKIVSNPRDQPNMPTDTATGITSLTDMAAVDGDVYWIEGGSMWKWSVGGDKEQLYPTETATSLDVDPTYVYWTTGTSMGSVKKAPR